MTSVITHQNQQEWNALVADLRGHPLQLWGWGETKRRHGWKVERVQVGQGGAQLLIKRLPKPFGPLVYIPRGPFGSLLNDSFEREALVAYVKRHYSPTLITIEPDTVGDLNWKHWQPSSNHILIARTAVLDLSQTEEQMLAVMTKKTRQYIRKSSAAGIVIRTAETIADIDACLAIYKQTAKRAGFDLHGDDYYHDIFTELGASSPVYMAEYQGRTVAFLWPVVTPEVAFELYGGMNDEGQSLRANYFLKWSVIQDMKQKGITRYDVNGLLNDGVTTFKKGFIPDETLLSGTYDRPLSPLYFIWKTLLPTAKKIIRRIR